MNRKISIALWNDPFLRPLAEAFANDAETFDVSITSAERCEQLALAGMVDVALMRTHVVLLHEDDLDVYNSAAISSWRFPYARLVLAAEIGEAISSVQYDGSDQIHAIVGRIVLNEHYKFEPLFEPAVNASITGKGTGIISTSPDFEADPAHTILDLGQEWFELTGYPMVWGLFAVGKGNHLTSVKDALSNVVSKFKLSNDSKGVETDNGLMEDFYSGDIRVGYDDLVTASLTEFSHFLYFYNIVDEPVAVPVVTDDDLD